MPRELKISEQNELVIFDSLTGEKIKFFYKTPTTDNKIAYQSAVMNSLTKKGGMEDVFKIQLEWAKKFITGFEPGYFFVDGVELTTATPAWKEIIAETAGDLLIAFAKYLFGESSYVIKEESRPFLMN